MIRESQCFGARCSEPMVEGIYFVIGILGSEKAAVWNVNFQFRFRQDEQDLLDFFFPQFPDETEEPHSACAVIQYTLSGKILFYRIAWIIFFCVVHLGRQKNNYPEKESWTGSIGFLPSCL